MGNCRTRERLEQALVWDSRRLVLPHLTPDQDCGRRLVRRACATPTGWRAGRACLPSLLLRVKPSPHVRTSACIPCLPSPPSKLKAASVIRGDCMHLLRCQLLRDRAHLLADVVLAHALSEGQQLAFDIRGALPLQRRSAEFVTARTVTGRARRDAACRIARRIPGGSQDRSAAGSARLPEHAVRSAPAARPDAPRNSSRHQPSLLPITPSPCRS